MSTQKLRRVVEFLRTRKGLTTHPPAECRLIITGTDVHVATNPEKIMSVLRTRGHAEAVLSDQWGYFCTAKACFTKEAAREGRQMFLENLIVELDLGDKAQESSAETSHGFEGRCSATLADVIVANREPLA